MVITEVDVSPALQRLTDPAYNIPSLGTVVTKATSRLQIKPEEAPIATEHLNEILLVSNNMLYSSPLYLYIKQLMLLLDQRGHVGEMDSHQKDESVDLIYLVPHSGGLLR